MGPRGNLWIAAILSLLGLAGIWWLGGPLEDPAGGARTWTAGHDLALARQERALAAAIRIQERAEPHLFRIPGVQGTGVGWTATGRPALHLYVERAMVELPEAAAALPRAVDGLAVVVRPVNPFLALQEAPAERAPDAARTATGRATAGAVADRTEEDVDRFGRFDRPVPIGVSTGHPDVTAGTIGALATDGLATYALSNYHVYVVSPRARLGDRVLQPGPADGGVDPGDAIGTLAAFEPIEFSPLANNRIDAALARTTEVAPRTPSDGYGAPREEPLRARPGMAVQKYGRTTGLTRGDVDAINATVSVRYRTGGMARFTGQVIVCCSLSRGGDSGSLVVRHDVDDEGRPGPDDRRPVALLFAGDGRFTIANPIDEVLDAFGVRIVGDETP